MSDLRGEMRAGFDRVDKDVSDLRGEMNDRFERVDDRFDRIDSRFERADARVDDRFDALNARFDAMQRTMLQVGGGLIGTLLLVSASLLVARF